MARGVNKVIIVGNLGGDPEVKYMPSGNAVTNITLATSESWKDKQTGQNQERTEWHRVVFFNKLAEIAGEYLRKGAQIYIEGALRTRKWQDQSGADRYTTEIVASELQMLGSAGNGNQRTANQGEYPEAQQQPQTANRNPDGSAMSPQQVKEARAAAGAANNSQQGTMPNPAEFDSDIPF